MQHCMSTSAHVKVLHQKSCQSKRKYQIVTWQQLLIKYYRIILYFTGLIMLMHQCTHSLSLMLVKVQVVLSTQWFPAWKRHDMMDKKGRNVSAFY